MIDERPITSTDHRDHRTLRRGVELGARTGAEQDIAVDARVVDRHDYGESGDRDADAPDPARFQQLGALLLGEQLETFVDQHRAIIDLAGGAAESRRTPRAR